MKSCGPARETSNSCLFINLKSAKWILDVSVSSSSSPFDDGDQHLGTKYFSFETFCSFRYSSRSYVGGGNKFANAAIIIIHLRDLLAGFLALLPITKNITRTTKFNKPQELRWNILLGNRNHFNFSCKWNKYRIAFLRLLRNANICSGNGINFLAAGRQTLTHFKHKMKSVGVT